MKKLDKKNVKDVMALTPVQEGMLYHYLKDPSAGHYFEQLSITVALALDIASFERAWEEVAGQNEMLRTHFRWEKVDHPVQVVLKESRLETGYRDVSGQVADEQEKRLKEIRQQDRRQGFDLTRTPFRVTAVKLSDDRYEMIISHHHILFDGWSSGIILREFFAAYQVFRCGESPARTEKSSFREYVRWWQDQDKDRQAEYWRDYLLGLEGGGELSIKQKKPGRRGEDKRYRAHLPHGLGEELKSFCGRNQATPATVFYAAYGILLHRYNSIEDVVFGTTVSGRTAGLKGVEDVVGLFINTIPLRLEMRECERVKDLLGRLAADLATRQVYEQTSLLDIKGYSGLGARKELFDSLVVIENYPMSDLPVESFLMEEGTHYALTIGIIQTEAVEINLMYDRRVLQDRQVERLAGHYVKLVAEILTHEEREVDSLEMLDLTERRQVVQEFNRTAADYPLDKTIPGVFLDQAGQSPDRVAVIGKDLTLTYRELARRAGGLAQEFRARGVGTNTIVGIQLERSMEMVEGILGILLAGGAYLPIGPETPEERVQYMLADSGAEIVIGPHACVEEQISAGAALTHQSPSLPAKTVLSFACGFTNCGLSAIRFSMRSLCKFKAEDRIGTRPKGAFICFPGIAAALRSTDSPLLPMGEGSGVRGGIPTDLAYVIYTSGSTGRPKGVLVNHASAMNILYTLQHLYPILPGDTYLLKTSFLFDVSVAELFGWFMGGGRLAVLDKGGEKDPQVIRDTVERFQVSHINFVPSMFHAFLEALNEGNKGQLRTLRYLFLAGEALLPVLVKRFLAFGLGASVENLYGPTEGTVYSSYYSLVEWDGQAGVPIGRPVSNVNLYIGDGRRRLQPIGVPGELMVAGRGLARGYLNNPELSAEKFVTSPPNPLSKRGEGENVAERGAAAIPGKQMNAPLGCVPILSSALNLQRLRMLNRIAESPQFVKPQAKLSTVLAGSEGDCCESLAPDVRLYKTGDLCRWLDDGNIEYLGRIDHQVKIRGFRIELQEIETGLLKHPAIKETVVVARNGDTDEKYLCAYIVARDPGQKDNIDVTAVREFLSRSLPDYMVPTHIVILDHLPLTHTGKIDRKALPKPEIKTGKVYEAPRNEMEKTLVALWADVLNISAAGIGIDDNFLDLGGHSLKAIILLSRIHKIIGIQVPMAQLFNHPTIRATAQYLQGEEKTLAVSIDEVEKKEYYPLSSAQQRLYILQQMEPHSTHYHLSEVFSLEGIPDADKLARTLRELISRHESLRTSFIRLDEGPVQLVQERVAFELEVLGAGGRGGPGGRNGQELIEPIIQAFIRPFDLSRAPLLRVGLLKLAEDRHLLVDMHHIIADGTSLGVMIRDFVALYAGNELLPPGLQYKDFAVWQTGNRQKGLLKGQEAHWLAQFQGEIPVLHLPLDYPRPASQGFVGHHLLFELGEKETMRIKGLAFDRQATLFMFLSACFQVLMAKLSGQEDIVVGTPVAGRQHADLQDVIGMFVNTLPLRGSPSGDKSFLQFLEEVKNNTLAAFQDQGYPFEELVEQVVKTRDMSRNPIFDVMFVLQNMEMGEFSIPGLKMKPYPRENRTAKFDLTMIATEVGEGLAFSLEYATALFREETAARFVHYYRNILMAAASDPGQRIWDIEIMEESERDRLVNEFNCGDRGQYHGNKTLVELFNEQVEKNPDRTALSGETVGANGNSPLHYSLSYSELDRRAADLAERLIDQGVLPNTIVGLQVERSIEMIIGMLGILKAGGAYLPIDPEAPAERVQYMLADSGAEVILNSALSPVGDGALAPIPFTTGQNCAQFCLRLHELRAFRNSVQHARSGDCCCAPHATTDLAYVIYTSGSTGQPKGVAISHRNLCPLLHWGYEHLVLTPDDRTIQNLSYFFDWSAWEIFITLTSGASLHLINREILLNPPLMVEFMARHEITVLHCTPSQFQYLLNENLSFNSLRHLCLGAEKLDYDLLKRSLAAVRPDCRVYNMYGPTEATIMAAVLEIDKHEVGDYENLTSVPIGRFVGNTVLWVLDRYLKLCPVGVAGELYIGGHGLARGYLNNPELTAEKFITSPPNPLSKRGEGEYRLYKTGDLCRWLDDGAIEFLGRIDFQVKIRGFRIELGEIEAQLLKHPDVIEAVVLARDGDNREKYLCAYLVAKTGQELETTVLREFLSQRLPGYMIPAHFIFPDRMPLNANGKVDRRALPEPVIGDGQMEYVGPADEIEQGLVDIWAALFGLEASAISTDRSFFDLGGHSLKATLMIARIHKRFGVEIPLAEFFGISPTVKEIASFIRTVSWMNQREDDGAMRREIFL